MTTKKITFILKCKNLEEIHSKYGIVTDSSDQAHEPRKEIKRFTEGSEHDQLLESEGSRLVSDDSANLKTNIDDIIMSSEPGYSISFYDEKKIECMTQVTMFDYVNKQIFPSKTNVKCFWCRYNFNTNPIGCPIKFVNSFIEKQYTSNITKDEYYMKENITESKIVKIKDSDIPIKINYTKRNYFLVDGIFCSFNCIEAFINENNHNVIYRESAFLLRSLYKTIYGESPPMITPAPHWRLLKDYGGTMSIQDFREAFHTKGYQKLFHVTNFECMKIVSHVFAQP